MAVSTTDTYTGPYEANGVTVEFPFTFKAISEDDVGVFIRDADGFESVADPSKYTVTLSAEGGTVTYSTAPASGDLYVFSEPSFLQPISFASGQPFLPSVVNVVNDRDVVRALYLRDRLLRSPQTPIGGGVDGQFPVVLPNGGWGWSEGTGSDPALRGDLANPDGAARIGLKGPLPDEVPMSAYLNLIEVKRVSRWGVDPANTAAANRAALQKAINSATKIELVFPDGDIKINDLLTTPQGHYVFLSGQGCGVSRLLQTDMTKGALKFDMNYAQGGGLLGMSIASDVAAGARGSSGVGLQVVNANDQFMARDFEVVSFDKCVRVDGSFQPSFKDFRLLYFANYGIFLSPYTVAGTDTAGTRWQNGKISNYGFLGANPENSDGILIHQGSGEYFDTVDVTQVGIPIHVAPPAGSFARFLKFKTVLADTAYYEGWMIDGTSAPTLSIRMVDCWAAGAGGGALRPAGSVRGAGLLTKGANLDDLTWIGGELRDNDCGGWRHEGGSNVRLIGASVPRNSRRIGFDNSYPGVAIAAGVSNWAVKDCRIGNFAQGVFAVSQAEAIVIEAGASQNFDISGNDLSNPGAGKACIANGSSSLNWTIRDNLPNQTASINYNRGVTYSGSSIGTIAAGATRYLSPAGQQAAEGDAYMVITDPGYVRQFLVQVDTAPGAGQSFTYTVRKNAANTVMTGTISGAGVFQLVLQAGFTVSAGDTLSISVVNSAGGAAARHRWALNVDV